MKIDYLAAMRIGESEQGRLTRRGGQGLILSAMTLGQQVNNEDVIVLCSEEDLAMETARRVLLPNHWTSDPDKLALCPEWPQLDEKWSEGKLQLVHKTVLAYQRRTVVAILPEAFAATYALHFMLAETIGTPNPSVIMRLGPGEICLVDCLLKQRRHIAAPGNSGPERMLTGR